MNYQEIEIKIQISDKELQKLGKWLDENADFKGEKHQVDHYLDNPDNPLTFTNSLGWIDRHDYLRVRESDKGASTCFKHWHPLPDNPLKHTHCDEYETPIESAEAMLKLYHSLGYTLDTIVDKKRKTYEYGDYEIVIDEVKYLGTFVEIEMRTYEQDPRAAHEKLRNMIKEMGIEEYKTQQRGYVSMLWNDRTEFENLDSVD